MKNIVITGVGTASALGTGFEDYKEKYTEKYTKADTQVDIDALCKKLSVRRNDKFTKFGLVAFRNLMENGQYDSIEPEERGVIANTHLGPVNTVSDFLKTAIDDGLEGASPSLFSNTVINAALGRISIEYKLKGISYMLCGANPLFYAIQDVHERRSKVVFAGGMDDVDKKGFYEGAVFLAIEDKNLAKERGANILAQIKGFGISYQTCITGVKETINPTDLTDSIEMALEDAGVQAEQIRKVYVFADKDEMEQNAVREMLDIEEKRIVLSRMDYSKFLSAGEFYPLLDALADFDKNPVKGPVLVNLKALDSIISLVVEADA